jgi:7-keto-8-aminopelargonate synthetase-like enzyme
MVDSQSDIDLEMIRRHYKIGAAEPIAVFAEPIEAFDGKLAAIPQIQASLSEGDYLILDEAQSFGVLGEQGRGALEHYNLASRGARLLRTGTFSKAVGTYGGFVMAADELIFEIKENAACLRGSTSLPPLLCAATREALRLIQDDRAGTIKRLKSNINYLNQLLLDAEIISTLAQVPIFYLPFNKSVVRLRQTLVEKGIYFPPMTSYFAGTSEVGLRWTIQAGHSKTELRRLVEILSVYA